MTPTYIFQVYFVKYGLSNRTIFLFVVWPSRRHTASVIQEFITDNDGTRQHACMRTWGLPMENFETKTSPFPVEHVN